MTALNGIDILSYSRLAGESCLEQVLGDFECPLNSEVEEFLKKKSCSIGAVEIIGDLLCCRYYNRCGARLFHART